MLVKAIRTGYDGFQRRKVGGDPFDWPDDQALPSWVEPTDPKDVEAVAKAKKARERAEHAKLMREAMGQNNTAVAEKLKKSEDVNAELRAKLDAAEKELAEAKKNSGGEQRQK